MPTLNGTVTLAGALVAIRVGVSEARRNALQRCGFPVPPPAQVQAVVDTGSFITLVDVAAVTPLGVLPYRQRKFFTAASGTTPQTKPVYDLSVTILDGAGGTLAYWPSIDVLEAVFLAGDVVHGVVGRDLLVACELYYNGRGGTFSLTT